MHISKYTKVDPYDIENGILQINSYNFWVFDEVLVFEPLWVVGHSVMYTFDQISNTFDASNLHLLFEELINFVGDLFRLNGEIFKFSFPNFVVK